jgi:hypothetical protein
MKATFLFLALATGAFAQAPVLARITPAALAKIQQTNPIADLAKPQPNSAKVERPAEQSIIKQSVILHDGQNWTIVPKGAVIHTPEALKARMDVKPVGTLLAWKDFLAKNFGWITTNEVTFDQAAGNDPLPAARVAFWAKQDKIVVAVHQGGPISVNVASTTQAITQR